MHIMVHVQGGGGGGGGGPRFLFAQAHLYSVAVDCCHGIRRNSVKPVFSEHEVLETPLL